MSPGAGGREGCFKSPSSDLGPLLHSMSGGTVTPQLPKLLGTWQELSDCAVPSLSRAENGAAEYALSHVRLQLFQALKEKTKALT